MSTPGISILCPTYGRTKVLVELIESFYRQTYTGPCELVILNDLPEQTLQLDPSEVRQDRPIIIINEKTRRPTLSDKLNALAGTATEELVAFWDDDDIYLQYFLEMGVAVYNRWKEKGWRTARSSHAWMMKPEDMSLISGGALWTMLIEKDIISEVGGFPDQLRCADKVILERMMKAGFVGAESNTPGMPQFIHRRGCTPYTQVTTLRLQHPELSAEEAAALLTKETEDRLASGEEPSGNVVLTPRWNHDYDALARFTFGTQDRPNMNQPPTPTPPLARKK